ncbi:hypothetical protein [Thermococcus sp.]
MRVRTMRADEGVSGLLLYMGGVVLALAVLGLITYKSGGRENAGGHG